jgi:hypothetical protein
MQKQIDDSIQGAFATLTSSSLEDQLMHIFDALTDSYAEQRRLSRVFIKELLFTDGQQRAESASWTFALVERIARLIIDAQRSGELDPTVNSMEAAQQLFSAHYFGLVTWLGGTIPSRTAHRTQLRGSLRLLLRGLRRSAA